jgi:acetolactate synthase I/II/III large subunit
MPDKEAVFMAAGRSSIQPRTAIAVLHGARGLTNALGAIADTRRSERHVLCLTGMASRPSSPYLPPLVEPGLIADAGRLTARHHPRRRHRPDSSAAGAKP